jgi:adenylate cyclase
MAELEWLQGGQVRGRLELQEGAFLRLGRGEGADGRIDGDQYMSRLHVEVVLAGGALRVRKLPNASNPVFHGGVEKTEFRLEPGESFVVGATRFRFLAAPSAAPASAAPADAPAERVMEAAEVYAVSDRMKLKDLLELPEILRTKDRSDFYFHIAGMLRLATGAQWAAVVAADRRILGQDAARDDVKIGISARLFDQAVQASPRPIFHSWRGPERLQATVFEGSDWAACAAVVLPGDEKLVFYVAGSGGSPSATDPANLDTTRYVGLVADIVGRSLSVRRLEEWETRFEHFFSRRVVESLLAGKDLKALEPKVAESTVMFFDIRGFSKLAELGGDAIMVFQEKLRRVMTGMTDEILKEEGVVLQYMGDGILACWNVPQAADDHVERACRAALAMTRRLAEVDPTLRCGIGLHTGRVVAGTIGSDQIFAYGVIGTVINQASRIEGITKLVGVPIIATREVVELLSASSGIAATPLGMFRPAGMTADLELYEISAGPADPSRLAAFEAAETAFAVGAWDDVVKAFAPLPAQDAAARYLSGVAENHRSNPPLDWRGVIELREK